MQPKILEGRSLSQKIKDDLSVKVEELKKKGVTPGLATIIVGDNPASASYVRMKIKACELVGIHSESIKYDADITQEQLLDKIQELNNDNNIHGILVQLPLPDHIDEQMVIETISFEKDVDGFHPVNVGKMVLDKGQFFPPCTPFGIVKLMEHHNIQVKGKHVVILGRSNIVGKPLANLLIQKKDGANATVTVCHSATENLEDLARSADILVAAMGIPFFVKENMVKEGAVIIDVGSNRIDDPSTEKGYRFVGDVDYDGVIHKVNAITPSPGGVGPMTIAMLLSNTVESASRKL